MTAPSLAGKTAEAFNRHGRFTARTIEQELAVEVRHIDTGDIAVTVWIPETDETNPAAVDQWMWLAGWPGGGIRYMPKRTPLDVLVPAVITHVLDEGPKR